MIVRLLVWLMAWLVGRCRLIVCVTRALVDVFVCLFAGLCVCMFVYVCACLSGRLFVRLVGCSFVGLCVCPFV